MAERYLIYSGEHRAFWRPNSTGYCDVKNLHQAGRYTAEEAAEILGFAGPEKQLKRMKVFDLGDYVAWYSEKRNGEKVCHVGIVKAIVPMHELPFEVYKAKGSGFMRTYSYNEKWWRHKANDIVSFLVGVEDWPWPRLYHPAVSKLFLVNKDNLYGF